jgi:nitrite reductase/ring-hydroxylating ferredoxin subunit
VGPGTPGGEYLRRYWHPVALSFEAERTPRRVRVLGENLVIYRDGGGRVGLLHERCAHRGASLYYGKTTDTGIRCCYHGWLFDADGRCLEQPCEPDRGLHRDKVTQPWYPVQERYGLVFAYLGPIECMPPLPRFDIFESLAPGEQIWPERDTATSCFNDSAVNIDVAPYNYFQMWENVVDTYHIKVLHNTFSDVAQFPGVLALDFRIEWELLNDGVLAHSYREVDGRVLHRIAQCMLPNIISIGNLDGSAGNARRLNWIVPVDDISWVSFAISLGPEQWNDFGAIEVTPDGRTWSQMSESERQHYPGDFEAQSSQGRITLHSEEHLGRSDKGVVMLRRLVLKQIAAIREGRPPVPTGGSNETLVRVRGGGFYDDAAPSAGE